MLSDQVILEALATIADLRASVVLTRPRLELEMLAAFMTFPVILGAEFFLATFECATVRFLVTLSVFPVAPRKPDPQSEQPTHLLELTLTRETLVTVFAGEETPGISHVFLETVCLVI